MLLLLFLVLIILVRGQPASAEASWAKRPQPVLAGEFGIASDPEVIHSADGSWRMYYTGLDAAAGRTVICAADSRNGINWRPTETGEAIRGLVFRGRAGEWDEKIETPGVIDRPGEILLFYAAYRPGPADGFPRAVFGVERTGDGRSFTRAATGPVMEPTPGSFDNDAVYSPSIARDGDHWIMAYTGHAYTNAPGGPVGVRILSAVSDDGLRWTKSPRPMLEAPPGVAWAVDGVAEPSLISGQDHRWYLFFTGLRAEERVIGVARADTLAGPWEVLPRPIVSPTPGAFDEHQVIAPCVRCDCDVARMWYTGVDAHDHSAIGYAEARWPIWPGAAR